ncbi:DUF4062 domain-containing protein [Thermaerobacillus caldiproteolyticus]|uniref:DUF4062 domain-containing protein n=1 Tax=Thermaerobacillus caldiproteolyticus TaxID=247480 RepID=UPI00188B3549|nr:DUF4062 domain-containing protein [Anoxybacillus caldiproteolyticus]QPA32610.1 DUF4062 domain-containing protein [Anoxybacillus caldiproteolyticus]
MYNTTIFISSVAQDSLSPIRKIVFEELKNMGHEPIRFEDTMQYIHQDAVRIIRPQIKQSLVKHLSERRKEPDSM